MKVVLAIAGLLIFCSINAYFAGYFLGKRHGVDWAIEMQKRVECEVNFDNKPYSEIDGKCLKYFENKKPW